MKLFNFKWKTKKKKNLQLFFHAQFSTSAATNGNELEKYYFSVHFFHFDTKKERVISFPTQNAKNV